MRVAYIAIATKSMGKIRSGRTSLASKYIRYLSGSERKLNSFREKGASYIDSHIIRDKVYLKHSIEPEATAEKLKCHNAVVTLVDPTPKWYLPVSVNLGSYNMCILGRQYKANEDKY